MQHLPVKILSFDRGRGPADDGFVFPAQPGAGQSAERLRILGIAGVELHVRELGLDAVHQRIRLAAHGDGFRGPAPVRAVELGGRIEQAGEGVGGVAPRVATRVASQDFAQELFRRKRK